MMIPEAWENHESRWTRAQRAFYDFHSTLMEPWDGPACVAFTDGTVIGAVLDRNGLRPGRYWVTDDDLVVLASEVGVLDIDPARSSAKGRLQPGRMFLVDTAAGPHRRATRRSRPTLAAEHPYERVAARRPGRARRPARARARRAHPRHRWPGASSTFGYTHEELKILLAPMAAHRWRAARLDGHRHADRRAVRAAAAAVRLLHPAVRPGHQPAARRHPRGAGHLAGLADRPRGQPARRRRRRTLPPDRAAVPDHRQRRARQDRPHQRRRRPARLQRRRRHGPLPTSPAAGRRCARGSTRSAPRSSSRDRRRRAHHRAVRPQRRPATSRRSRRCCSPPRCTTT